MFLESRVRCCKNTHHSAEERAKLLPELFKRAEELMKDRLKKEINASDVINPPPTPETDGHDNSCDDTENLANLGCGAESPGKGRGELTMYEDDFLDLQCSNNEMDLF
ncbi:hypothetical protein HHI36_001204 [Cryptolaemus montrouzieri]|uniref:Uncharacterized protein n=1 Tax=Cryptolaemus montrouzieri TaxID=559131 RepID=A0ABD2P6X6_9CUCU